MHVQWNPINQASDGLSTPRPINGVATLKRFLNKKMTRAHQREGGGGGWLRGFDRAPLIKTAFLKLVKILKEHSHF